MQTFLVETIGRHVGGCHQRHSSIEQAAEQIAQNHRIADVAHEQLVETEDARLARDLVGNEIQRIGAVLVLAQLIVHRLHEAMKVTALLVLEGQRLEEQVHEPGLAATDAAPEIQSLFQFPRLATEQRGQHAFRLRPRQSRAQIIEEGNDPQLDRVLLVVVANAFASIQLGNRGRRREDQKEAPGRMRDEIGIAIYRDRASNSSPHFSPRIGPVTNSDSSGPSRLRAWSR